jgi:cyclic-di-AMP phosphodiesterase PgpH
MFDKARARSLIRSKSSSKDPSPVRSKSNGAKRRFSPEAKRWFILTGLSLTVAFLLFPNFLNQPKTYKLGDVVDRDIKASRELLLEDTEVTEKNRQEEGKSVLSVYDFDPAATASIANLREIFAEGRDQAARKTAADEASEAAIPLPEDKLDADSFKVRFFEVLDIPPDDRYFDLLMKGGFPTEVEDAVITAVSGVLRQGVVNDLDTLLSQGGKGIILHDIQTEREAKVTDLSAFHSLDAAKKVVREQIERSNRSLLPPDLIRVSSWLAVELTRPNLTFNKRETELRKDFARKSVKPFYTKVKKGEMLVREGERIRPEHLLKLSEQSKALKNNEVMGRIPAMAVLISLLLFSMYLVGLMNRRAVAAEVKDLFFDAVTLFTIFLGVVAAGFVAEETARGFYFFSPRALLFAIPVASGAMLISIFRGMLVATSFSLIVSVFSSLAVGGGVEFFIYFFVSSLVAAHGVRGCRERGILIRAGLRVSLVNLILAFSIQALYGSFYSFEMLIAGSAALLGGILAAVITTGLIPLVEMSFGYTTDIKLLELANLDQPLLRELMVQAPGTYHHSVIVSNMVEATAKAIDANPLLAKTAAYYHDIGKMKKPLYFIENQMGCQNRHEKLAPSMSSLILISHVKDGVELAREHKLGQEISDIIRQHHGTSLISFFYEKAKEQVEKKGGKSPQVKEEDFRYPGPKPQTKEAGLVMLADMIEAASRSLVEPNASRIQGLVQRIINKVFSDGQLDECELTLKDLHEIAKSFNKTLSGIFHHRVEYPQATTKVAKKGTNGNPDHLSSGDSWGKKPQDKAEIGESLKRLGMS